MKQQAAITAVDVLEKSNRPIGQPLMSLTRLDHDDRFGGVGLSRPPREGTSTRPNTFVSQIREYSWPTCLSYSDGYLRRYSGYWWAQWRYGRSSSPEHLSLSLWQANVLLSFYLVLTIWDQGWYIEMRSKQLLSSVVIFVLEMRLAWNFPRCARCRCIPYHLNPALISSTRSYSLSLSLSTTNLPWPPLVLRKATLSLSLCMYLLTGEEVIFKHGKKI